MHRRHRNLSWCLRKLRKNGNRNLAFRGNEDAVLGDMTCYGRVTQMWCPHAAEELSEHWTDRDRSRCLSGTSLCPSESYSKSYLRQHRGCRCRSQGRQGVVLGSVWPWLAVVPYGEIPI